ncbi:MAG: hypothetical protein ACRDPO_11710 [Streptosporangiaceae bacterium]
MGLMDKVKAQAGQLAQKTQETAREGKARLDQAQANRRADMLLRNLGALVYSERTNRGTPDTDEQVNKLIGDISAHEAENGINLSQSKSATVPPQGGPEQGGPEQGGPEQGGPEQGGPEQGGPS